MTDYFLTLHTPLLSLPPPPPLGLLSFLIPRPYHYPVCRLAHGHTGVFHNNFLWYKLWALIFEINPFPLFFPTLLFPVHFSQYLIAEKNAHFFCRTIIWEILFPALSIVPFLLFWWPMPIIYFEGIKPPCNPVELQSLVLWGGKGDRWRLTTTVYDSPTRSTNFQIQII